MADIAVADDEGTLVALVANGDHAAFERLMRTHNRRLYRIARAALRDDAEAQDAMQEAYLAAYRGIRQFRGEAALATWLSRVVLNECRVRLRRTHRRDRVIPMVSTSRDADCAAAPAHDADLPDRVIDRAQVLALIERKLDALPEDFRLAFVLRSVEELSVEEAAAVLGISEATVRSRHFRAKSLLREALARELDLAQGDVFEFGGERCDRITAAVLKRVAAIA